MLKNAGQCWAMLECQSMADWTDLGCQMCTKLAKSQNFQKFFITFRFFDHWETELKSPEYISFSANLAPYCDNVATMDHQNGVKD